MAALRFFSILLVLFQPTLGSRRLSTIKTFQSWCVQNGITGLDSCVSIANAGEGLGIFASREISAGEEILRVPLKLAMADRLLVGMDGVTPKPPFTDAPWQATLAQRLATAGDVWEPWLRILPEGVQGLDHLSCEAWLQYEQAALASQTVHSERAELASRLVEAADDDSVDDGASVAYERGVSLAHTRAFLLELVPGDAWAACHAFVPLVDLFNHAPEDESAAAWSLEGGGNDGAALCMVLHATRAASSGDELSLTYEPTATNDDFCVYHGFVPRANACDDVELFADVPSLIAWHREAVGALPAFMAAELEAAAQAIAMVPPLDGSVHMRRVGVASAGAQGAPLWLRAGEMDARMWAVLRLLSSAPAMMADEVADDGAVDAEKEGEEDGGGGGGDALGRRAASALVQRCEEMLAAFPTTLEDDLGMLGCAAVDVNSAIAAAAMGGDEAAANTYPPPAGGTSALSASDDEEEAAADARRVAVRYRAGKKLVLLAAMRWLGNRWDLS